MRRNLLTDAERQQLFGIPSDQPALIQHYTLLPEEIELLEGKRGARNRLGLALQLCLLAAADDREVIRHYTLSEDDFDVVMRKRLDTTRLGYALALCLMRHPGRSLEQGEALPVQIVGYVARQLDIAPGAFDNGPDRDKERRKHLAEAMRRFGYRPFDRAVLKDFICWLTPSAQVSRVAEPLIDMMIDELRRRQILLPSPRVLELVVHQARHRGERVIHEALIGTLSVEKRAALDALLAIRPETTVTQLAWLQNASRSPAARNILRLIDRLQAIRELALDRRLAERVPALVFERLAAEGRRMTAQHIRDLTTARRHAVLFATVVALETELTDATLFMFDKLMGSLARRAENKGAPFGRNFFQECGVRPLAARFHLSLCHSAYHGAGNRLAPAVHFPTRENRLLQIRDLQFALNRRDGLMASGRRASYFPAFGGFDTPAARRTKGCRGRKIRPFLAGCAALNP